MQVFRAGAEWPSPVGFSGGLASTGDRRCTLSPTSVLHDEYPWHPPAKCLFHRQCLSAPLWGALQASRLMREGSGVAGAAGPDGADSNPQLLALSAVLQPAAGALGSAGLSASNFTPAGAALLTCARMHAST